jgi:hypothetical protein
MYYFLIGSVDAPLQTFLKFKAECLSDCSIWKNKFTMSNSFGIKEAYQHDFDL